MEKLYIDFKINGSLAMGTGVAPTPLGKRSNSHLMTRYPWEMIPEEYIRGINLVINLNPDPNKIEDYNNKKLVNNMLMHYIDNEKNITKAIGVYEWGKNGPKYGKLHYHMLLKTSNRKVVEENLSELFNDRRNLKCRTINTKFIKDVKHRTDYLNYMKKEQQNKIKCLFIKNI